MMINIRGMVDHVFTKTTHIVEKKRYELTIYMLKSTRKVETEWDSEGE